MYLVKHFFEIVLGTDPGSNGITEKDEVLNDSRWVVLDHFANTSKRRVLLFVVTNIAKRRAPVTAISLHGIMNRFKAKQ